MLKARRYQSGVTLIELIITVLVAAILAGIAVPNFNDWLQSLKVKTAAESILNGLQIARAEAVRRNEAVQFTLGTSSTWIVGCVTITSTCPANIQSSPSGEAGNNSLSISTTPTGANTAIFNNFGSITNVIGGLTQINIDITPTGQARNLRITISAGGNVRMCNPNLAAPDARAC